MSQLGAASLSPADFRRLHAWAQSGEKRLERGVILLLWLEVFKGVGVCCWYKCGALGIVLAGGRGSFPTEIPALYLLF
ncbi:hypothetical protein CPHO_04195 [Corynebacterium phocae]|uniref:Uncharacterized protein n=1 Tax=Corynebacterium phocae TaxID=161895 RepID=A0A1L7D2K8_9CORY|nr:hypothetical protein CPHO_04195 [Corynebacterium phocae]